ncbi:MAG: carbon-nitrogen hydrolase family protein [Candidatus Bathyarchaeia archaeon]
MVKPVKIAAVQMSPKILEKEANLERCLDSVRIAAKNDARLIVFPECALTGYCFSTREEAVLSAEPVPGWSTRAIADLCKELNVYVVIGLVEASRGRIYNSAALIGPEGLIGKHRKSHLPVLGLDRFVEHGDLPFRVYDTPVGKLGMAICFEIRFPENPRVLALNGVEILVLPTNWPEGADQVPEFVVNTRAYENRINVVAVNRVGVERSFRFIGRSKIVDTSGRTQAEAGSDREEIIYATVDAESANIKHVILRPKEFELPLWTERRPEMYRAITRRKL